MDDSFVERHLTEWGLAAFLPKFIGELSMFFWIQVSTFLITICTQYDVLIKAGFKMRDKHGAAGWSANIICRISVKSIIRKASFRLLYILV
jgi:hypothetical protein